jgi:hypothetical protein
MAGMELAARAVARGAGGEARAATGGDGSPELHEHAILASSLLGFGLGGSTREGELN